MTVFTQYNQSSSAVFFSEQFYCEDLINIESCVFLSIYAKPESLYYTAGTAKAWVFGTPTYCVYCEQMSISRDKHKKTRQ